MLLVELSVESRVHIKWTSCVALSLISVDADNHAESHLDIKHPKRPVFLWCTKYNGCFNAGCCILCRANLIKSFNTKTHCTVLRSVLRSRRSQYAHVTSWSRVRHEAFDEVCVCVCCDWADTLSLTVWFSDVEQNSLMWNLQFHSLHSWTSPDPLKCRFVCFHPYFYVNFEKCFDAWLKSKSRHLNEALMWWRMIKPVSV